MRIVTNDHNISGTNSLVIGYNSIVQVILRPTSDSNVIINTVMNGMGLLFQKN